MTTDISVGVRWDPINQQNETINQDDYEFEYDGGNSSSRLFERSRIKALAGTLLYLIYVVNLSIMLFHMTSLGSNLKIQASKIIRY